MIAFALALGAALGLYVAAVAYDEWQRSRPVQHNGGDAGRAGSSPAGTSWLAAHELDVRRRQLEALDTLDRALPYLEPDPAPVNGIERPPR